MSIPRIGDFFPGILIFIPDNARPFRTFRRRAGHVVTSAAVAVAVTATATVTTAMGMFLINLWFFLFFRLDGADVVLTVAAEEA